MSEEYEISSHEQLSLSSVSERIKTVCAPIGKAFAAATAGSCPLILFLLFFLNVILDAETIEVIGLSRMIEDLHF